MASVNLARLMLITAKKEKKNTHIYIILMRSKLVRTRRIDNQKVLYWFVGEMT